jgi:hypothetical protein
MTSFELNIWIYNLSLYLVVTPLDAKYCHFKVEDASTGSGVMILKYLPDRSWIAEKTSMKFFTKEYIHQLGKLIEIKRPEWFDQELALN